MESLMENLEEFRFYFAAEEQISLGEDLTFAAYVMCTSRDRLNTGPKTTRYCVVFLRILQWASRRRSQKAEEKKGSR